MLQSPLGGSRKQRPRVPMITPKTRRGLRWKTLGYLLSLKEGRRLAAYVCKKPLSLLAFFKALFSFRKPVKRDGNLFFYRCDSLKTLLEEAKKKESHLVIGFSYCQKPKSCPVGRFNALCDFDPQNPACQACSIGGVLGRRLGRREIVIIPTFMHIAEHLKRVKEKYPDKNILFVITACELSLEMFGEFVDIWNLKGVGVRLVGRVCNTMKAFKFAERGIKPGVTELENDSFEALVAAIVSQGSDQ